MTCLLVMTTIVIILNSRKFNKANAVVNNYNSKYVNTKYALLLLSLMTRLLLI